MSSQLRSGLLSARPAARLAAGLGLAVFVLAGLAAVQVADHSGRTMFLPLAQNWDARAAVLSRSDPKGAAAMTWRALALRPVSGSGLLRLAEIQARPTGRLGPQGITWLERSYDVAPYDPQLVGPRVRIAFDHWDELPPDLRRQALGQVRTAWLRGGSRAQLRAAARVLRNPGGRLALATAMFELRVRDQVANAGRRPVRP
jgi:hypothetical protein